MSFVYGQQDYDNPHSLSKEQIRQMLAESTGHPPCANCAQIEAEAYARGCVDQHERTKVAAVKVAESYAGSTPPRYTSGISKGASPSQQADNCINAMKIRSREIAAAIEKMEMPV